MLKYEVKAYKQRVFICEGWCVQCIPKEKMELNVWNNRELREGDDGIRELRYFFMVGEWSGSMWMKRWDKNEKDKDEVRKQNKYDANGMER